MDVIMGTKTPNVTKSVMTISTVKIAVFHVETVKTMRSVIILMEPALMDVIRGIKAPNVWQNVMLTVLVRIAAGSVDTVSIIHHVIT